MSGQLKNSLLRPKFINGVLLRQLEAHRKVIQTIRTCDKLGIEKFCANYSHKNVASSLKGLNGLFVDGKDSEERHPIAWKLAQEARLESSGGSVDQACIRRWIIPDGYYYKKSGKWYIQTDFNYVMWTRENPDFIANYYIRDCFFKTYNFKQAKIEIVDEYVSLILEFMSGSYGVRLGAIEKVGVSQVDKELFNKIEQIEDLDYEVSVEPRGINFKFI